MNLPSITRDIANFQHTLTGFMQDQILDSKKCPTRLVGLNIHTYIEASSDVYIILYPEIHTFAIHCADKM